MITEQVYPILDDNYRCGTFTRHWSSVVSKKFEAFNSYTDASNYELGVIKWDTDRFTIGTEALGTGTARALALESGTGTVDIYSAGTISYLAIGTAATGRGASNGVTIGYNDTIGCIINVRENAALSIATNDLGRWIFRANGDFEPVVNNAVDVGASSLRVKKIWGVDGDFSGDIHLASNSTITANGNLVATFFSDGDINLGDNSYGQSADHEITLDKRTRILTTSDRALTVYDSGGVQRFNVNTSQSNLTINGRGSNRDTFEIRPSTGSPTIHLYNTYTDASNYERGVIKWDVNELRIKTEADGSGVLRPIKFDAQSFTTLAYQARIARFRNESTGAVGVYANIYQDGGGVAFLNEPSFSGTQGGHYITTAGLSSYAAGNKVFESTATTTSLWTDGVERLSIATGGDVTINETLFCDKLVTLTTTVTTTSYSQAQADSILLVDDDTAGSTVTINLLLGSSAYDGSTLKIKKLGTTANVIIDGSGAQTIDGAATFTLTTQYESVTIVCDGTNWHII